MTHLLRDEYRIKQVTKASADTLEELVRKLDDVDAKAALDEIEAYNAAVKTDVPFNPEREGRARHARGSRSPSRTGPTRSTTPPFEAYAVTCGITFTFGGLRIDTGAQVIDTDGEPIPGPVRRGRAGRRPLLLQLSGRHRADERLGVRPDRRRQCWRTRGKSEDEVPALIGLFMRRQRGRRQP